MARSTRRLNFILRNSRRASASNLKNHDADNFFKHLKIKIKNCEDGKKIKKYLELVVPKWETMTPNRLYKHIQKMHENAEQIRRFEIDLTWRRALYFIPLVVIFFSAFGIAFFNFYYDSDVSNSFISAGADVNIGQINIEKNVVKSELISSGAYETTMVRIMKHEYLILIVIAFINACLCSFLTKMNIESHRWQNNWEYHIDYLQQILGFKLIQTCLRPKGNYFTIRKINALISFFVFLIWYSVIILLLILLFNINFYCYFLSLAAMLFLINDIYYCLTRECLYKTEETTINEFYPRRLEIFAEDCFPKFQILNFKCTAKIYIDFAKSNYIDCIKYIAVFFVPLILAIPIYYAVYFFGAVIVNFWGMETVEFFKREPMITVIIVTLFFMLITLYNIKNAK